MTDESKLAEQMDRARRAEILLGDDLFKAAVEAERNEIFSAFRGAAWSDEAGLRALKIRSDTFESLLRRLRTHIETGKFAAEEMTRIQKAREAIKRGIRRVA